MSIFTFPKNFLWGTATAGHQVEGGNINTESWVLEHTPGSFYAEASGDSIDHYHRYRDDIALLAGLGYNAYRFSIEWARIEPEQGEFSRAALDHYRRMLACCHEHGLTPVVTFNHFTSPRWLMRSGGWESKDTPDKFARYCEHAAKHLGDLIGVACTMNEPNLPDLMQMMGWALPVAKLRAEPWWAAAAKTLGTSPEALAPAQFVDAQRAFEVFIAAHRKGSAAIKAVAPIPTGMTLALVDFQHVPGGEQRAAEARRTLNDSFLEALRGDDFVGVQTYSRIVFGADGVVPPPASAERNQAGIEFYPEALEGTIRHAAAISRAPIIVTENGLCTTDDTRRIEYIRRAVMGVANCLKDGLNIKGYFYWSAFDNFEWVMGYKITFGLVAVDRTTMKRTVKPSAHYLGEIARKGTLDQ